MKIFNKETKEIIRDVLGYMAIMLALAILFCILFYGGAIFALFLIKLLIFM